MGESREDSILFSWAWCVQSVKAETLAYVLVVLTERLNLEEKFVVIYENPKFWGNPCFFCLLLLSLIYNETYTCMVGLMVVDTDLFNIFLCV